MIHHVSFDPWWEAWRLGICRCERCMITYTEIARRVLALVAAARGLRARVVVARESEYPMSGLCGAPGCSGECSPMRLRWRLRDLLSWLLSREVTCERCYHLIGEHQCIRGDLDPWCSPTRDYGSSWYHDPAPDGIVVLRRDPPAE